MTHNEDAYCDHPPNSEKQSRVPVPRLAEPVLLALREILLHQSRFSH